MEKDPPPNLLVGTANFILDQIRSNYPKTVRTDKEYYGYDGFEGTNHKSIAFLIKNDSNPTLKELLSKLDGGNFRGKQLAILNGKIRYKGLDENTPFDPFKKIYHPAEYLEIYSVFLGKTNFTALIDSLSDKKLKDAQKKLWSRWLGDNSQYSEGQMYASDEEILPVPQFLLGLHEGYFIDPKDDTKSSFDEFSILYALIKPGNEVELITSDSKSEPYKGKIEYIDSHPPHLRMYLESERDRRTNKFRIDLRVTLPDRKYEKAGRFLSGTYGGQNAVNGRPIAGRMLLRQLVPFEKLPENIQHNFTFLNEDFYTQNKVFSELNIKVNPRVFQDNNELSDFFYDKTNKENREILTNFLKNEYVEDIEFLKRIAKKDIRYFSGVYAVYYLAKDLLHIHKAILRIERNGRVSIKGGKKSNDKDETEVSFYEGYADYFDERFLVIHIEKRDNVPHFFQYILLAEIKTSDVKFPDFLQGVRTTVLEKERPGSTRVVLKKYQQGNDEDLFNTKIFERFNIFPTPRRKNGKFVELNKNVIPYNRNRFGLGDFLIGITDNMLRGFDEINHDFSHKENFKEVFFATACYYGEVKKDDEKFLEYLHQAKMHGFHGHENIKRLKEEMNKPWYKGFNIKRKILIIADEYIYMPDFD